MLEPIIYHVDEHQISPDLIADEAKIVIRELQRHGYKAYLVGGGVRDLCLGKRPKDFDIATSATPEQIKPLFRHCLLIGRRFRLAHVRFKKLTIEVATFRAGDTECEELIEHDNTWGSPHEDALRRDFTLNGLFYDLAEETVIDYVGGFKDLQQRVLKTIGDATVRFRQDPVRMIRLLKFQARYGELTIDSATLGSLQACRTEIVKSSSARLLEELLRMLESSHSAKFFHLMSAHGLLEPLMPHLENRMQHKEMRFFDYLRACDFMHATSSKKLSRDCILASVVWSLMESSLATNLEDRSQMARIHEVAMKTHEEIEAMKGALKHIPKRMKTSICSIIGLQARLSYTGFKETRSDFRRREKVLQHPSFLEALQLLELRALVDTRYSHACYFWLESYHAYRSGNLQYINFFDDEEGEEGAKPKEKKTSKRPALKKKAQDSQSQALFNKLPASGEQKNDPEHEESFGFGKESELKTPVMRALIPPPTRLLSTTIDEF